MSATIRFANGSTGTISYVTGGNARFPKETLDVAGGGRSARLDNFQRATVWCRAQEHLVARSRRHRQGPAPPGRGLRHRRADRRADADPARLPGRHHAGHDRRRREPGQWPSGAGVSSPVAAKLAWYAARAGRMSPAEVAWRARDQALRLAWQRRQVRPGQPAPALPPGERGFTAVLLPGTEALVPGRPGTRYWPPPRRCWPASGTCWAWSGPTWPRRTGSVTRSPAGAPPRTGTASGSTTRSAEQTGNIKQVWEISRLQHLTLLATAWYLSRDEAYAGPGRGPAAVLVAAEPVPVRRALDQRHRARGPADQPGLDPAAAGRLAGGRRTCSSAIRWRWPRSAGISSTWPPSAAAVPRPTTTSSPRRPASSWPAARSRGSPRRRAGGGTAAALLERPSWRTTLTAAA